ncbi:deazaflavin-dependent oxidoreductase (nitroreductase family) [Spinactinospora alkalitolerans]|uniref:Deazaflavin-dependent oxidoreductase (Nitroreductase family) n=2 Tax=Spinactinospora alkalitolerans TaxID=687207 RepID=A0A852TTM4_9ACTN|nr:deazaflavin-dependent oxidoreductase (nitroreductase family) [Spinactinospora alkalitolerans]
MFEGGRLLLLTTTGARTGLPRTTPVGYLPDDEAGRRLVIASAAGAPAHPAWYHNILADPRVTVEDGVFTYSANAVVTEGEERDRLFARAVESDPGWGEYQAKTARTLPVIALEPIDGGPPDLPPGDALKAVHDGIRRELGLIRAEITAAGPGALGAQLRINCLTMCQGVHHHHTAEDGGLFPALRAGHPELAPVVDRLSGEHEKVERLLKELQKHVSDGADTVSALGEVERLTAELEAHLDYEEEQLVPLLNALGTGPA